MSEKHDRRHHVLYAAFAVLLLFLLVYHAAVAAELPQYRLVYKESREHYWDEAWDQPDSGKTSDYKHYDVYLQFDDDSDPVFLSSAFGRRVPDGEPHIGMGGGIEPGSIELRWLDEGRLLHVAWRTVPCGSGSYRCNSDMLLLKRANSWRSLFRDTHKGYFQHGAGCYQNIVLSFEVSNDNEKIVVREERVGEWFDDRGGPRPALCESVEGGAFTLYVFKATRIREWECQLRDEELVWSPGVKKIDLGEHEFAIEEVALYTLGQHRKMSLWNTDGWQNDPEVLAKTEQLKELNPSIRNGVCTGQIVVERNIDPYRPFTGVAYNSAE